MAHMWLTCMRLRVSVCLHDMPHNPSGLRLSLAPRQKKKKKDIPFISSVHTDQMMHILHKQRQIGWQILSLWSKHAMATTKSHAVKLIDSTRNPKIHRPSQYFRVADE